MKKSNSTEKRCVNCGRIIVDETNKTGLCPKCTKKGVGIGIAAVAAAPGVVVGLKKYGKQIVQGLAKLVLKR